MEYYQTADPLIYGKLRQFVTELRNRKPTIAETRLWDCLRGDALGVHFRRQHVIGPFIADFCCLKINLVVEIDGGYHHLPEQQISDAERTDWLNSIGYKVIRFTNEEVYYSIDTVLQTIQNEKNERNK